ncbi:hypothetical protein ABSL23_01830 [Halobacterium sp. NMX12-1]|uniref:Histidine kinase N-terminal 7TM region domain-containing protein n=1 Tax=Halobacterium sp. NMX12-1 TaxID=3166650 RepID=A0AAU8CFG2_9EURY
MPGQPWPVLGSTALTLAVAASAGLVAALATFRAADQPPRRAAALVGVPVAIASLALWWVARYSAAYPFPDYGSLHVLAGWLALAFVVLAAQVGLAAYAFARWRLVAGPVAAFAAVTATWYYFLRIGGETDVLWLWAALAAPVLLAATALTVGIEYGARRAAGQVEA